MALAVALVIAIISTMIFVFGTFKAIMMYRQSTYLKFFHYSGIIANSLNCVSCLFTAMGYAFTTDSDQQILHILQFSTWYIAKIIIFWIITGYLTTAFSGGALQLNTNLYYTLKTIITLLPFLNLLSLQIPQAYTYIFITYSLVYIFLSFGVQWKFNHYIRLLIATKVLNEEPLNDVAAKPCDHEFCDLLRTSNSILEDIEIEEPKQSDPKFQLISSLNPLLFRLLVKQTTLTIWIIGSLSITSIFMILFIIDTISMHTMITIVSIDSLLNLLCLLFKFQYSSKYYNKLCRGSRLNCEYPCFKWWDTTPIKSANWENPSPSSPIAGSHGQKVARQISLSLNRMRSKDKENKRNNNDSSEVVSLIRDSISGLDLIVYGWINDLWGNNGDGVGKLRLPSNGVVSIIKLYSKQCSWSRHTYKPSAHGVRLTFIGNSLPNINNE